jgi:hypothetical protein
MIDVHRLAWLWWLSLMPWERRAQLPIVQDGVAWLVARPGWRIWSPGIAVNDEEGGPVNGPFTRL